MRSRLLSYTTKHINDRLKEIRSKTIYNVRILITKCVKADP